MEKQKVFASQQLICMLPSLALKVMLYLLNWQKFEVIKYYEKQMCKFMHIEKEELQLAIQTLIDNNLIDVSKIDNQWCIQINKKTVNQYFNVKMETVAEHKGIELSKSITWNQETEVETKQSSNEIEDMSDSELKLLLQRIQISLNERSQMAKCVVTNKSDDDYQLPF